MSQSVSGSATVRTNTPTNLELLLPITGGNLLISISPNSGSVRNTGTCYLPSSKDAELHVSSGEFEQLRSACPKDAVVAVSLEYDGTGENNVKLFGCANMSITFYPSASAAA